MKISVITVAYNSEKTLGDTIRSVLSQTYGDIEYIVVDGNSKDGTMDIVRKYEPEFHGRMKYVSEPDGGIYDAMNKGIKMASGDVVGTLNSDDIFASNDVIEKVAETFADTDCECMFGNLNLVDSENPEKILREWNTGGYRDGSFKRGWHPAHPTFYAYKKLFEKFGYYRTDFKIAADFELMLRFIGIEKVKSSFLDKLMVIQRAGGASTKLSGHIRGNIESMKAFKVNNQRCPIFLIPGKVLPKMLNFFRHLIRF